MAPGSSEELGQRGGVLPGWRRRVRGDGGGGRDGELRPHGRGSRRDGLVRAIQSRYHLPELLELITILWMLGA